MNACIRKLVVTLAISVTILGAGAAPAFAEIDDDYYCPGHSSSNHVEYDRFTIDKIQVLDQQESDYSSSPGDEIKIVVDGDVIYSGTRFTLGTVRAIGKTVSRPAVYSGFGVDVWEVDGGFSGDADDYINGFYAPYSLGSKSFTVSGSGASYRIYYTLVRY